MNEVSNTDKGDTVAGNKNGERVSQSLSSEVNV